MLNRNHLPWKICCIAAIGFSVISFTPLVTPIEVHQPVLFGLPRSLWAGLIVAIALELVVIIAGMVHPQNKIEEQERL